MKLRFIFVHFVLFRKNVVHRNPLLHTYIKPYMQVTLLHLLASLTIIVSVDAVVVLVDYHFIHRVFFNIFAYCESCTSLSLFCCCHSFFSFRLRWIQRYRDIHQIDPLYDNNKLKNQIKSVYCTQYSQSHTHTQENEKETVVYSFYGNSHKLLSVKTNKLHCECERWTANNKNRWKLNEKKKLLLHIVVWHYSSESRKKNSN